jgi:predicted PurR-regulated permease PerM
MKLGLPPEIVYYHVREGVGAVAVLGLLLILVLAWRLGLFAPVAPVLATSALLAALTPTVLAIRRRYRHVVAGVLVLTAMLAVLAAAVHHYGNPPTVASIVDPTHATIADAVAPR